MPFLFSVFTDAGSDAAGFAAGEGLLVQHRWIGNVHAIAGTDDRRIDVRIALQNEMSHRFLTGIVHVKSEYDASCALPMR